MLLITLNGILIITSTYQADTYKTYDNQIKFKIKYKKIKLLYLHYTPSLIKHTIVYHFLFDIFDWSAAVTKIVIHLKSIALYIYLYLKLIQTFFFYFIYLFIDFILRNYLFKVGY